MTDENEANQRTLGGVPVPEAFMPQIRHLLEFGGVIIGDAPKIVLKFDDDVEIMWEMTGQQRAAFMDFIIELETVMDRWQERNGERPYARPLSLSTGLACWKDMFDDGMSAAEAFEEDRQNWE